LRTDQQLPSIWQKQHDILYDPAIYMQVPYQFSHLCGNGPWCICVSMFNPHGLFEPWDYNQSRDTCRALYSRAWQGGDLMFVRWNTIDAALWSKQMADEPMPHNGIWAIQCHAWQDHSGEPPIDHVYYHGHYMLACHHDPPCI